jgi:CBS domain containing-hemolysin-like protein
MTPLFIILGIACAALVSLVFSSLTYSLRDFSRVQLEERLDRRGLGQYLDPTITNASDLIFATAVFRLLGNLLVLIGWLRLLHETGLHIGLQYVLGSLGALVVTLFVSVAIPHALARHAGETLIALCIIPLHGMRSILMPIVKLMHLTDALVRRAASGAEASEPGRIEQEAEQEILSAVEQGEQQGVVDETERRMIESVIAFHNAHVGQAMTSRPEIFAIDVNTTLLGAKASIEESGHSRVPVYDGTLDHVVGVLYARDLIRVLGDPLAAETFSVRKMMRPPLFVPETKPLGDLLKDFRMQKVHIAIVLDEYGGTAGLVTIEDIFELLVGDISDEHEAAEPAMLVRTSETVAEADARIEIGELNRVLGTQIPQDAGYETLGGFVMATLGQIPSSGASFEYNQARFTILDAEPQKVNRVRIELLAAAAAGNAPTGI